jgi:hypothetical protein
MLGFTKMIFSLRYFRALNSGQISVELAHDVRRKLWSWLVHFNYSFPIRRDPNDSWVDNTCVLEEVRDRIKTEHAWDSIPGAETADEHANLDSMRDLILNGSAPYVFDVVELSYEFMDIDKREEFRNRINETFELYECRWRFSEGELFLLDREFVGARLTEAAHSALRDNHYAGAMDEYAKCRQYLASGDIKDAIFYAGKSFESVLKVITGLQHVNADRLIKEIRAQGYLDDLPENVRAGFADQVLKTLPFLRNKLGGQGQGAMVVDVPPMYGELAIQIAASLHNFLIAKHLQRRGTEPETLPDADDIPF